MYCEKVIVGAGTDYPLNGLLTLPDGTAGPSPAVVMVHGSGASDKPALILQGGRDFQVLPQDDYREFQRLLAGRENTVFKLYPDLNHVFARALYDDILKASKEYGVERHIGDEVIDDVAAFVRAYA